MSDVSVPQWTDGWSGVMGEVGRENGADNPLLGDPLL